MKQLKKLLIILIIVAIIIIIVLQVIKTKNKKVDEYAAFEGGDHPQDYYEVDETIQKETNIASVFFVKNIITNFSTYLNENNTIALDSILNEQINNFEKAYNILPDLRAPELEMGVSVNLTWEQGNQFDIEVE